MGGITDFLDFVGEIFTNVLTRSTEFITWIFEWDSVAGMFVNWPILIPMALMIVVFVYKTVSNLIKGV